MRSVVSKFTHLAYAVALFLSASVLMAQPKAFEGTWQMDSTKSKVLDGRVVTITIVSVGDGVKMSFKTKKGDGPEKVSEFTTKLDGKTCDLPEGDHVSQLTVWYDGSSLNASKEKGPATDVTSMWKWELSPDKQTMTMKINHYEPAADDETLVFTKKTP